MDPVPESVGEDQKPGNEAGERPDPPGSPFSSEADEKLQPGSDAQNTDKTLPPESAEPKADETVKPESAELNADELSSDGEHKRDEALQWESAEQNPVSEIEASVLTNHGGGGYADQLEDESEDLEGANEDKSEEKLVEELQNSEGENKGENVPDKSMIFIATKVEQIPLDCESDLQEDLAKAIAIDVKTYCGDNPGTLK